MRTEIEEGYPITSTTRGEGIDSASGPPARTAPRLVRRGDGHRDAGGATYDNPGNLEALRGTATVRAQASAARVPLPCARVITERRGLACDDDQE